MQNKSDSLAPLLSLPEMMRHFCDPDNNDFFNTPATIRSGGDEYFFCRMLTQQIVIPSYGDRYEICLRYIEKKKKKKKKKNTKNKDEKKPAAKAPKIENYIIPEGSMVLVRVGGYHSKGEYTVSHQIPIYGPPGLQRDIKTTDNSATIDFSEANDQPITIDQSPLDIFLPPGDTPPPDYIRNKIYGIFLEGGYLPVKITKRTAITRQAPALPVKQENIAVLDDPWGAEMDRLIGP